MSDPEMILPSCITQGLPAPEHMRSITQSLAGLGRPVTYLHLGLYVYTTLRHTLISKHGLTTEPEDGDLCPSLEQRCQELQLERESELEHAAVQFPVSHVRRV